MNCREFVEFLMDYLDGALPASARTVFEEHMVACPPCVNYLASYAETVRLGKEVCGDPEDPVPDDVPEELVAAILKARSSDA